MSDFSSPLDWSASQIARRIANREISAVEVTRAFIDRIQAVNPRLNAVVLPRFDEALAEAAAVDQELSLRSTTAGQASSATLRGQASSATSSRPLLGVPITLKECFYLAGTPSTIGLTNAEHQRTIETDGILVERLRRAGAIVLGKTNVPQLMIWHESDNPVYGRTNNPWNLERTCGGSSGGEAAIIAAGGSPLGLGNDLGGSIRVPCHFCGIHGLRPTSLRLPRHGAARTLHGFETFVTQAGPMARHVEDLWLALQVLADNSDGYVAGDVAPVPLRDPKAVEIDKLKIAAWTDDGLFPPSPAVARAVQEAIGVLKTQGAEVVELSAPEVEQHFHAGEAFDLYCSLVGADGGTDARRLAHGSRLDPRVARLMRIAQQPPPVRALMVAGLRFAGQGWTARIVDHARPRSADGYWRLVERKNRLVSGVMSYLREQAIGAILCPPYALPAPPHVKAFDLLPAASYSLLINLLGLPSGALAMTRVRPGEPSSRWPIARDKTLQYARETDQESAGLPVAVQVASLPWREDTVLAVMQALETRSELTGCLPTACDLTQKTAPTPGIANADKSP
jgi:fatty acid amide hydrolase